MPPLITSGRCRRGAALQKRRVCLRKTKKPTDTAFEETKIELQMVLKVGVKRYKENTQSHSKKKLIQQFETSCLWMYEKIKETDEPRCMAKLPTKIQLIDQCVLEAERRFGRSWPEGLAHHIASLHCTSTRFVVSRRLILGEIS